MILISLQSLPPSVKILQNLESYFMSPLQSSRVGGRTEALASFTEFWNDCCKHLTEPKQGWSSGIKQALALAFPGRGKRLSTGSGIHVQSAPEREIIDLCSDDDEDKKDSVPLTNTPRRRNIALLPLPPSPCNLNLKAFWFGDLDLGLGRGVDVEKSID